MYIHFLFALSSAMLPGTNLKEYSTNDTLSLYVNKLDSSKTLLPYKYNYLEYCDTSEEIDENIGQELSGNVLRKSLYEINMNTTSHCKILCTKSLTQDDKSKFEWMIENEYNAFWVLDSLPAGESKINPTEQKTEPVYKDGFPIGFKDKDKYYVFNHHEIEIHINENNNKCTVVGFFVNPLNVVSVNTTSCKDIKSAGFDLINNKTGQGYLKEKNEELDSITNITFSYQVTFKNSSTKWGSRWKSYLSPSTSKNSSHYYNLINSTVMVMLLTAMVATILRRSVLRDVSFYNDSMDDIDSGWKQVRSDVFRAPVHSSLFCITIGTGTQLLATIFITLMFAVLEFLSAKYQGALLSAGIIFYALMGIFAGYTSARLFKMFGGQSWQKNAIGTALMLPGLSMFIFMLINLFLWKNGSSSAVSFTGLLYILAIWLVVSLGLVYMGAFIGSSKNPIQNTCRVAKIPKPIEITPGLNKLRLISLLAGVLPFGSVLIEMTYIMSSLWHPDRFYHFFGFMFICSIILVITAAEAAILLVYLLLCREDYRWWWLSVFVPGSSGIYLFVFSFYYCFHVLQLSLFTSYVLYFGYMFLICVGFAIVTGTIGFYASFIFIRTIYSMIKQD